jgi:hypothetical protein
MTTTDIATAEEIDRRVEVADRARGLKRSAAAKQVGELAQRRTMLAVQLDDVERQLGEVLADASDVLDIDELARFTNIPASDLMAWLTARKPARGTKKKPAASAASNTTRGSSAARTPANGHLSVPPTPTPTPAAPRTDAEDAPGRVTASVT